MPKTPNAQAPQRADSRGGTVLLLPKCVLESEQWRELDFRARCAVIAIASHFNGYNNGAISVSTRQLIEAMGSGYHVGNEKAVQAAIAAGFLERTRVYPKAQLRGTEYRLTWVQTGKHPNVKPATHEYLVGEVVRKQRRQQPQKSVSIIDTGACRSSTQVRQQPVSMIDTGNAENVHSPVPTIDTHISITTPPSPRDGILKAMEASRGLARPRSMAEDTWVLAQRRAAANPATADDDHVRTAAISYLSSAERGEQTRLSEAAGIPGPALSKFLKGGTLADDRLGRLMLELMKRGGASIARAA